MGAGRSGRGEGDDGAGDDGAGGVDDGAGEGGGGFLRGQDTRGTGGEGKRREENDCTDEAGAPEVAREGMRARRLLLMLGQRLNSAGFRGRSYRLTGR